MYLLNEADVNLPNSRTWHRIARRVERAGLARSCLIPELPKILGYRVCGENMYSDRNYKQTFDNYIMTFCSNDGPTAADAPLVRRAAVDVSQARGSGGARARVVHDAVRAEPLESSRDKSNHTGAGSRSRNNSWYQTSGKHVCHIQRARTRRRV